MRVLIIDDEPIILLDQKRIITETLQEIYPNSVIQVEICNSSKEAIELVMKNHYSIVFSDIDMPKMKGIELCNLVEKVSPQTNLIFVTGFDNYSTDAWGTFACGFLTKPLQAEDIKKACKRLRYSLDDKVVIQCFGAFDVLYQGKKVIFSRKKSLEMLAVLVDQMGSDTSIERIRVYLWDESEDSDEKKAYVRQLARDIRNSFANIGVNDILINTVGGYYLNKEKIDCDYFNLIEKGGKKPEAYMTQFEWANENSY